MTTKFLTSALLALLLPMAASAELVEVNKKDVDVKTLLVPGKDNIVVFHNKPTYLSHQLYSRLGDFSKKHPDVPIFVVDVPGASSPLVKRYALRAFPAVQIYDKDGVLTQQGPSAYKSVLQMLDGK